MTNENTLDANNVNPKNIEGDVDAVYVSVAQQPVDQIMLRKILEGAILAAGQPLSLARLMELFDEAVAPLKEDVLAALHDIGRDCDNRGYELKEVASGWRFQVREDLALWVNRLWDEKPQKYSRALLETLALIAYRQPITRGDIEEIRGVAVSSHIMKTLMEREWVKVVGHRDVPGRPSLYATTRQFLDYFNLRSLEELPSLGEIRDLDELNSVLDLEDDASLGERDTETDLTDQHLVDTSAQDAETNKVDVHATTDAWAHDGVEDEFVDGEEAFEVVENVDPTSAPHHLRTNNRTALEGNENNIGRNYSDEENNNA